MRTRDRQEFRPAARPEAQDPGSTPQAQRAGVYLRQPGGYRAFEPKPLPPDPPLDIDGTLQALLSRADRELGRLDGSIQTLPHPDRFVFMYVRKEAVLSSQIEGTQSSLQGVIEVSAEALGRIAGNGHRVLEYLFDHPIVSVNEVRDLLGTTCPAANDLVAKMEGVGILQEITGQARNRRYRYGPYVALFQEG